MLESEITLNKSEQLKLLNTFLVNNSELEQLSAKLSVFNMLSVLKIERTEIRHSNILAWLLDPQGSHGLGQTIVQRLISSILLENEDYEINITPVQIELMNMADVEVLREWRNIDLLIISHSNKWVLLIENKVRSKVSKKQLLRYLEIVKKEFPGYVTIPVIITLEDEEAFDLSEDTGYVGWSHSRIYKIINYVVHQREDRIPEDAKIFIDHYLTTLRRITMQDKEIADLCKQIYKKHKDAIDLIVEYGTTNQFDLAAESFMSNHKNFRQLFLNPRGLWFIHQEWEKYMPHCSDRWKFLSKPYPVACRFRFGSEKVGFIIEVGSMEDTEKRMELIKIFDSKGFRIGKKSLTPESKYTRVFTVYRKIEDPDDEEIIEKQLNELWDKSKEKFEMVGQIIKEFNWN